MAEIKLPQEMTLVFFVLFVFSAKKYAELHSKTDEKKEKKAKAAKEEKPKQPKQEKKEKSKKEKEEEEDDVPKEPKSKDPYAGLPKRLENHAIQEDRLIAVYNYVIETEKNRG